MSTQRIRHTEMIPERTDAPMPPPTDLLALREKIMDFKRGTVYADDFSDRDEVDTIQKTLNVVLAEIDAALSAPSSLAPLSIGCPLCGKQVNQVASATLSIALWQHTNWACEVVKAHSLKAAAAPSSPLPSETTTDEPTT